MPDHAPHPALAPVLESLARLSTYQPTGAADLADLLKGLHGYDSPNVLDGLIEVLRTLATWARSEAGTAALGAGNAVNIIGHLYETAIELAATGADHLDRAREVTGHYHGTAATNGGAR
jgi:hypothetical protein